jgi:hypothetical protein
LRAFSLFSLSVFR